MSQTTIIQLSDLQFVDIIGNASRLELTDESFEQLLSKLERIGCLLSKTYEYHNDNGEVDYHFIVRDRWEELKVWNGEKYVEVEFTEQQLRKLDKLIGELEYDKWEEPWHPYRDGTRYEG